jgi:hypothetical protein
MYLTKLMSIIDYSQVFNRNLFVTLEMLREIQNKFGIFLWDEFEKERVIELPIQELKLEEKEDIKSEICSLPLIRPLKNSRTPNFIDINKNKFKSSRGKKKEEGKNNEEEDPVYLYSMQKLNTIETDKKIIYKKLMDKHPGCLFAIGNQTVIMME